MIREHQAPHFDESVRRIDDPVHEGPGPQGAALILELQKLRHAFDVEGLSDRRARVAGRQYGEKAAAGKEPAEEAPAKGQSRAGDRHLSAAFQVESAGASHAQSANRG